MEENDKSKNSENKVQEDDFFQLSNEDEKKLSKLLGIKLMDTSVLEELRGKIDYTDEDLKKLLDYTEYVKNFMEEEKKHPRESSIERITSQLAQERVEYMKKWNAMTKEEQIAEMDRKSKVTEELARKSGAKLYEVKVNEDALSQMGLTDEIEDNSKDNK